MIVCAYDTYNSVLFTFSDEGLTLSVYAQTDWNSLWKKSNNTNLNVNPRVFRTYVFLVFIYPFRLFVLQNVYICWAWLLFTVDIHRFVQIIFYRYKKHNLCWPWLNLGKRGQNWYNEMKFNK